VPNNIAEWRSYKVNLPIEINRKHPDNEYITPKNEPKEG